MIKYRAITISGNVAVGTSTLAKNLQQILGWKYINVGDIQRQFDRKHNLNEHKQGARSRGGDHERSIDEMTKKVLSEEKNIIYEAWLSAFMAQGISDIFKVLLICSNDAIRVDRIVNRDNVSIQEAKEWIKQREEENIPTWKKLYGDYDFFDPKYYDLVIDTYSSGPMETVGKVLDKIGYRNDKPV